LIDQPKPFFGGQLTRIAPVNGVGAAVHAGERASSRHFPDDEKRGLVEVGQGDVRRRHDDSIPQ
jgi:hypothetical protein